MTINVGLANNGSVEETFTLTLHDDTDDEEIATQDETLASGTTSTVAIDWDTTGATGGPPPPGQPAPGSIHRLKATVELTGDTNSSNDSKSLEPGIWIIAAPEPEPVEISYPEPSEEPDADYGDVLVMAEPGVNSDTDSLTNIFVSRVPDKSGGSASNPTVTTKVESLAGPYSSPADAIVSGSASDPSLATEAELLNSPYATQSDATVSGSASDPSIGTDADILNNPYASPAAALVSGSASDPSLETKAVPLAGIVNSSVHGSASASATLAGISTNSEGLTDIFHGRVPDREGSSLGNPNIATIAVPLPPIEVERGTTRKNLPMSGAQVATQASPLTGIFETPVAAETDRGLIVPDVDTDKGGGSAIYAGFPRDKVWDEWEGPPALDTEKQNNGVHLYSSAHESMTGQNMIEPAFIATGIPLSEIFLSPVQGEAGGTSSQPKIETLDIPLSHIFQSPVGGIDGGDSNRPPLVTAGFPLSEIFHSPVAGLYAGVTNMPEIGIDPKLLLGGNVRGRVMLEGQPHSLGAYVEIAGAVTFVDRDGYFVAQAPAETFDLYIKAPGFVPVVARNVFLEVEEIAVIPTVTLAFGDADGNGAIDLTDLFLVSRNFGATMRAVFIQ